LCFLPCFLDFLDFLAFFLPEITFFNPFTDFFLIYVVIFFFNAFNLEVILPLRFSMAPNKASCSSNFSEAIRLALASNILDNFFL